MIPLKIIHNCPECLEKSSFSAFHDAYFCMNCDIWLDEKCSEPNCQYCNLRPDKPHFWWLPKSDRENIECDSEKSVSPDKSNEIDLEKLIQRSESLKVILEKIPLEIQDLHMLMISIEKRLVHLEKTLTMNQLPKPNESVE
jgi:hypothetical protein